MAFVWVGLLCVVGAAGCGPTLAQQGLEEARQRERVRRDALRIDPPEVVHIQAGKRAQVTFSVKVAPGFYLPSRDEPDKSVLATWLETPTRSFAKIDQTTYPHGALVELPGRVRPLLAYDGAFKITLRFSVHRNVPASRYLLPFVLHYQLCTVRGCEVPEQRTLRISFEVAAAEKHGNLNDLAPPE